MNTPQKRINELLDCIELEMLEQENRYSLNAEHGLKQLKSLGILIHPIQVIRKSFGYADYPEIIFRLPYKVDTFLFKGNDAIECFVEGEDAIKGVLLNFDGLKGEFRLFAPDFPDWIEGGGVGVKLSPDHHSSKVMKEAVKKADQFVLFNQIHGESQFGKKYSSHSSISYINSKLNSSQKEAVVGMLGNENLLVLHGPPGTGKTTTIVEGVLQLVKEKKKILIAAPSNAAVDNVARQLIGQNIEFLRVGNALKTESDIFPFTLEGNLIHSKESKDLKKLKIRATEFRKMALQYKRNFGREDREQRKLLLNESKKIKKEIRLLKAYFEDKLFEKADVVLGTPIGIDNFLPENCVFDTLIMDEAGQCLEPMYWTIHPYAKRWVLAGDPYQLPPTVLSQAAKDKGYAFSILEQAFRNCNSNYFIDTQYRMRNTIAEFSNQFFYEGKLKSVSEGDNPTDHVVFYDTAGTGFNEQAGEDGNSLMNEGEVDLICKILKLETFDNENVSIISPYSAQVLTIKDRKDIGAGVRTIDSFQGQENECVIVSLVRSNEEGEIGFLKDYRRMNVALTRAKEKLIVIGDSVTIGQDRFYAGFLEYIESIGAYKSAWELMD